MPEEQKELFQTGEPLEFKNCVRCNIRCRVAAKRDPSANLFIKGTKKTGRYCANCLVVDFFKNCEIGFSTAFGKEYFDRSLPQPEWRRELGDPDRRFDPACLREPETQRQMTALVLAAQRQYGAQLTPEEIDWDEVIANWDLPFPEGKKGRKK